MIHLGGLAQNPARSGMRGRLGKQKRTKRLDRNWQYKFGLRRILRSILPKHALSVARIRPGNNQRSVIYFSKIAFHWRTLLYLWSGTGFSVCAREILTGSKDEKKILFIQKQVFFSTRSRHLNPVYCE
jgi:hypothetical protein